MSLLHGSYFRLGIKIIIKKVVAHNSDFFFFIAVLNLYFRLDIKKYVKYKLAILNL